MYARSVVSLDWAVFSHKGAIAYDSQSAIPG